MGHDFDIGLPPALRLPAGGLPGPRDLPPADFRLEAAPGCSLWATTPPPMRPPPACVLWARPASYAPDDERLLPKPVAIPGGEGRHCYLPIVTCCSDCRRRNPPPIDTARGQHNAMARKARPAKQAAPRRSTTGMSEEHKAALAEGREQGRAVRRYLDALEHHRPKRGRRRSRESIERRLASVDEALAEADPVDRLHLIQERLDLEGALAAMDGTGVDLSALEEDFIDAAGPYGARRGISYPAWRAAGVPPSVLRRAGIARSQ